MRRYRGFQKNGSMDFDVAKVCFDEAEVCELVATIILDNI